MDIHPAVTLSAALIGGSMLCITRALLALPAAAKAFVSSWLHSRQEAQSSPA
jgi:predicted PurR-regulated permease PerM